MTNSPPDGAAPAPKPRPELRAVETAPPQDAAARGRRARRRPPPRPRRRTRPAARPRRRRRAGAARRAARSRVAKPRVRRHRPRRPPSPRLGRRRAAPAARAPRARARRRAGRGRRGAGGAPGPPAAAPLDHDPVLRAARARALRGHRGLSLHARGRPLPFRRRLHDPLGGGRLGGGRAARGDHQHRHRQRLGRRHPLRIRAQPGHRRGDRRRARPAGDLRPGDGRPGVHPAPRRVDGGSRRPLAAHGRRRFRARRRHHRRSAPRPSPPRTPGRSRRRSSCSRARW